MTKSSRLLVPAAHAAALVAFGLALLSGCGPDTKEAANADATAGAAAAAAGVGAGGSRPLPELALGRTSDHDYDPPPPGTYSLPPIRNAAGGRVLGEDGSPHDLEDLLDGRITILSFIYTRCADPKACPHATGVLYDIHQVSEQDPALAENLQLLTFSFDPEHDTPQVMADYGEGIRSEDSGGADWSFLTTESPEALAPILDGYGQVVDAKRNENDPLGPYYHVLRVYLIDPHRAIRNIYSFGMLDPRLVLADVRTLLLERSSAALE